MAGDPMAGGGFISFTALVQVKGGNAQLNVANFSGLTLDPLPSGPAGV
jgi:hypothetical protein